MATTTEVPGRFPIAVNGRPFLVDTKGGRGVRRRSVPFLKQQRDDSAQTGAASLNPEGAWRRDAQDWSHGAGQSNWDRDSSNPARFRSSKGVNVWDRWQLTLLRETANKRASAATNLRVLRANGYLYVADGTSLVHTTDITVATPTWVDANIQAGDSPANTVLDITTDGTTVYAAMGAGGVHSTTAGAATSTHYNAVAADVLDYVKGRLMVAAGTSIYNVTASGAAPTALFSRAAPFFWTGFAAGRRGIYAAGYSGDRTEIYRINIRADGSGLDTPIVAAELPNGEYAECIESYLGFILIGTTKGVRFAQVDGTGDLIVGSLIPTPGSVRCFESQDNFVWFGWTNYDGTSTGLGRLDLTTFTAPNTPAYASDVMATAQGVVLGATTFNARRVFSVNGTGIFAEQATKVASGTLDSGAISFGIPDTKVAHQLDVRHLPLVGSHAGHLSTDAGSFVSLGTHSTQGEMGTSPFAGGEARGERFETRLVLSRLNSSDTTGPTITRSVLSAFPLPERTGEHIILDVLLYDDETVGDGSHSADPKADYDYLIGLEDAGTVVDLQLRGTTLRVTLSDHEWEAENPSGTGNWWNGYMRVDFKVMS